MIIQFSSIWPIDRALLGQSGPGSDGNVRVLHIPQISTITEASLSDFLVSYPRHTLEESYLFTEMQSVLQFTKLFA